MNKRKRITLSRPSEVTITLPNNCQLFLRHDTKSLIHKLNVIITPACFKEIEPLRHEGN